MKHKVIIGSRGSDLALWQANYLKKSLQEIGVDADILIIKTQGDQIQHVSLEKLEGKGFFTKEIEDALLENKIDIAVHSHKDLPTATTPGLKIAAVSYREDPSELLLVRKEIADKTQFWNLPLHAKVGTSSSRRAVQLHFYRPDIQLADIRGNVPTRVQKLRNGQYDAILLAAAGVQRLQLLLDDLLAIKISPHHFIPAPAQGVLAYQCREQDIEVLEILEKLHHQSVYDTISVERKVMQMFNGGCHMPLGVYCQYMHGEFFVWATQSEDKLNTPRRLFVRSKNNHNLAEVIYDKLRNRSDKKVLFTTEPDAAEQAIKIVEAAGHSVIAQPYIKIVPKYFDFNIDCDWLFFTSKNGVNEFFKVVKQMPSSIKIAAFGAETAEKITTFGYDVAFTGNGLVEDVAKQFYEHGKTMHVVFPCAVNARKELHEAIAPYAHVFALPVYENILISNEIFEADIIACSSPMQAEGYLKQHTPDGKTFIAIGPTTARYLENNGISNVHVAPFPSLISMAELICGLV